MQSRSRLCVYVRDDDKPPLSTLRVRPTKRMGLLPSTIRPCERAFPTFRRRNGPLGWRRWSSAPRSRLGAVMRGFPSVRCAPYGSSAPFGPGSPPPCASKARKSTRSIFFLAPAGLRCPAARPLPRISTRTSGLPAGRRSCARGPLRTGARSPPTRSPCPRTGASGLPCCARSSWPCTTRARTAASSPRSPFPGCCRRWGSVAPPSPAW